MNNVHVFENVGYNCISQENIVLNNVLPNYQEFNDSNLGVYVPYLIRDDKTKKYEVGIGKLDKENNKFVIVREKVVASSSGYEPILSDNCKFFIFANEYNFNTAFNNVIIKTNSFDVDNVRATYIVDTTLGTLTAKLPCPKLNPSLIVDFKIVNNSLGKLEIYNYKELVYTLKGLNKYITVVSTGQDWVVLQSESANSSAQSQNIGSEFFIQSTPGGDPGELQYQVDAHTWGGANVYFGTDDKLLFGSNSEVTAKNIIPTTGDYDIEFNQTRDSGNFSIYGMDDYQNFTYTYDGSIGVNVPSGVDNPTNGDMVFYGDQFTTTNLTGNYNLFFAYDGRLGLNIPSDLAGPQTLVHFINWDCVEGLRIENRTTCNTANITLYHKPPTSAIADNTEITTIDFSSKNSDGNKHNYARVMGKVLDYSANSDGRGQFSVWVSSGTSTQERFIINPDRSTLNIGQSLLDVVPTQIGFSSENIIFSGNNIEFKSLDGASGTINAANINVGNTISVNNLELSNLANTSILTISEGNVVAASTGNAISIVGAPSGRLLRTDANGRILTDVNVGDFFRTNNDIIYSAYPQRLAEACLSQIIFDADDLPALVEYSVGDQISVTSDGGTVQYHTIANMTTTDDEITIIFTEQQVTPSTETGLLVQSISKGFLLTLQKYVDPEITSINDATSTVLSTRPNEPTVFNTAKKKIQFSVYTDSDVPGLDIRPSELAGGFVTVGDYLAYATNSDTRPLQTAISTEGVGASNEFNTANYDYASEIRWSGLLSNVGTNGLPSYYGTYDQNGNAAEWIAENTEEHVSSDLYYVAGGSITSTGVAFNAFEELVGSGTASGVGFRVSSAYGLSDIDYITDTNDGLGMEFINVGNPKNLPFSEDILVHEDGSYTGVTIDNLGRVNYSFRISKHEVTNSQYAAFLNSVATGTDNLGLYNGMMYDDDVGGIEKVGIDPISYVVKDNYGDKPVTFVSYLSAIRFSNWLHNGAPTGLIESADNITESGAYNIVPSVSDTYLIQKNNISNYYIPDIHEWYKSAYFKPDTVLSYNANTVLVNMDNPHPSSILSVGGNTFISGSLEVSGIISGQGLDITSEDGGSLITAALHTDDDVSFQAVNNNSLALVNSANGRLTIGPNPVFTISGGTDLDGSYRTGFAPEKATIAANGPIKLMSPEPVIVSGLSAKIVKTQEVVITDDEGNVKDFFVGPSGGMLYKIDTSEAACTEMFKYIESDEEFYLNKEGSISGLSPLYTDNTNYIKSYTNLVYNDDNITCDTLLHITNPEDFKIGQDSAALKGALLVHQGEGPLKFELNTYLQADGLTYNRYPKRAVYVDKETKRIKFVAPPTSLANVAPSVPTQEELDLEYSFGDTVAIMHTGDFEVEYVKLAANLLGPYDGPDALYITHPPIFAQEEGENFHTYACPQISPNDFDGGESQPGFTGIMYSITKSSIMTNGLGYGLFSQDPVATSGFDCVENDPVPNTPDAAFTFRPSSKYVLSTRPMTHTHFNAVGENIDFAIYGRTKFEYTRYYPEIFDANPDDGDLPAGLVPVFRVDANVPNAVSGSVTGIFYSGYVDAGNTIPTGYNFDQIGRATINTNTPYVINSIPKSLDVEPVGYSTLDYVADLSVNSYTYSSGIITDHVYLSGMHGSEYIPGAALTVDVNGKVISINPDIPPGPPGPPRNVQATAGNASANLNWLAPVDNGQSPILDYAIQYSTNNGATWTDVADTISNVTNQQVTDLVNEANYIFRVAAINQIGTGQWSLPSAQITPSSTFPGAVTAMSLSRVEVGDSGIDRITATWSAPLSSGASAITRYVIKYKKSADSTYLEQFVAANTAIDGVFTLVINGIDPGPQYTVQISAENNFGEGIPVSQTIDGTDLPPEEPPAPPDPYDFGQMTFNGACLT